VGGSGDARTPYQAFLNGIAAMRATEVMPEVA
jgi:hypothetical protein